MSSVGLGVVVVLVGLSGCTNPDNDRAEAAEDLRTITDAKGDSVDVPAAPERVVALSEPTLDATLALGVTPVGAAAARGQSAQVPAYLAELSDGVPVVGALGKPQLEQLEELDPDVILVDGTAINDEALLSRLDDIATTVWTGPGGNADWRASLRLVAEVLDREDEAEQLVADFDERVVEVNAAIEDPAAISVSIVRWGLASGSYLPPATFPGAVAAEVGLARPDGQQSGGDHSQPVSLENIDILDADWMFFCTLGGASNPDNADDGGGDVGIAASQTSLDAALDLDVGLAELEVYRSDHVVAVDGSVWGSAGGALAALGILDDLEETLA